MKKGFTLVEILVAVLIVGILVAMAAPMYEKTIEKSRVADVRVKLKRIYDSKMRIMDNMDLTEYPKTGEVPFGFENLDFDFECDSKETTDAGHITRCTTKDFTFSIRVGSPYLEGLPVCASRNKGDNKGVNFTYSGKPVNVTATTKRYQDNGETFFCNDANGSWGSCEAYGMDAVAGGYWCSPY